MVYSFRWLKLGVCCVEIGYHENEGNVINNVMSTVWMSMALKGREDQRNDKWTMWMIMWRKRQVSLTTGKGRRIMNIPCLCSHKEACGKSHPEKVRFNAFIVRILPGLKSSFCLKKDFQIVALCPQCDVDVRNAIIPRQLSLLWHVTRWGCELDCTVICFILWWFQICRLFA